MKKEKKRFAWSLWLPVTIAFLIIIGAWTTFIVISINHPTERVNTE
ncbi:MAG: hypothetical protein AAF546_08940 [Verrucomicrobiota bacterium]